MNTIKKNPELIINKYKQSVTESCFNAEAAKNQLNRNFERLINPQNPLLASLLEKPSETAQGDKGLLERFVHWILKLLAFDTSDTSICKPDALCHRNINWLQVTQNAQTFGNQLDEFLMQNSNHLKNRLETSENESKNLEQLMINAGQLAGLLSEKAAALDTNDSTGTVQEKNVENNLITAMEKAATKLNNVNMKLLEIYSKKAH